MLGSPWRALCDSFSTAQLQLRVVEYGAFAHMALALVESNYYRCCYACAMQERACCANKSLAGARPSLASAAPVIPSPLTEPHQTFAAPSPAIVVVGQPLPPAFAFSYRQRLFIGSIICDRSCFMPETAGTRLSFHCKKPLTCYYCCIFMSLVQCHKSLQIQHSLLPSQLSSRLIDPSFVFESFVSIKRGCLWHGSDSAS
jgi:hypothetical protein